VSSTAAKRGAFFLALLLGLLVLLALGAELFTLNAHILKNYNEGWNAYHIMAASQNPAALYPPRESLFGNNYPPLSFFLAGALAKLTGDAIIAGRIMSFACVIGTGLLLAAAARAVGCSVRNASLAALLFWAAPWVIVRFTAMNDPELLGNFLDAVALLLILTGPRDLWHVALSALFLTLAEFVKPLYVTLPLALAIWLLVYERRSAVWLTMFGIGFAILGYAISAFLLKVELFQHVFSPRLFVWSRLTGQPGQLLLVEALPFAASLMLFRQRDSQKDSFAVFAALYAALAFALAVFFSGGDGVSASQMMDANMAVALGAALYLERFQEKCEAVFRQEPRPIKEVERAGQARWAFPALAFTLLLQSVMLVLSFLGLFASRPSLPDLMGTRYATQYDTDFVAAHADPVMCESLALCYWAGRKPQLDAFSFHQAVQTGARPAGDLVRLIDRQAFSLIQLQPGSYFGPPSPFWTAITRSYYLDHQDKNGLFLVPRDQPLADAVRRLGR
jgi:hypothetical protein